MFTVSFHHEGNENWFVRCPELNVELSLVEPMQLIAAAEITGWLPDTSHARGERFDSDEMDTKARLVLSKNMGRDFPVSMTSEFADRLWEIWMTRPES